MVLNEKRLSNFKKLRILDSPKKKVVLISGRYNLKNHYLPNLIKN